MITAVVGWRAGGRVARGQRQHARPVRAAPHRDALLHGHHLAGHGGPGLVQVERAGEGETGHQPDGQRRRPRPVQAQRPADQAEDAAHDREEQQESEGDGQPEGEQLARVIQLGEALKNRAKLSGMAFPSGGATAILPGSTREPARSSALPPGLWYAPPIKVVRSADQSG